MFIDENKDLEHVFRGSAEVCVRVPAAPGHAGVPGAAARRALLCRRPELQQQEIRVQRGDGH